MSEASGGATESLVKAITIPVVLVLGGIFFFALGLAGISRSEKMRTALGCLEGILYPRYGPRFRMVPFDILDRGADLE